MKILNPVPDLTGWSTNMEPVTDTADELAKFLGRQNVTYEPVWQSVEKNAPMWTPVLCNSLRRALLLASSAIQHRTQAFDVVRRGRLVFIRKIGAQAQATA